MNQVVGTDPSTGEWDQIALEAAYPDIMGELQLDGISKIFLSVFLFLCEKPKFWAEKLFVSTVYWVNLQRLTLF